MILVFYLTLWALKLVGTAVHELGHYLQIRRFGVPAADLRVRVTLVCSGRVELRERGEWLRPDDGRFPAAMWARCPRIRRQVGMLATGQGLELATYALVGAVGAAVGLPEAWLVAAWTAAFSFLGVLPGDVRAAWRMARAATLAWQMAAACVTVALFVAAGTS